MTIIRRERRNAPRISVNYPTLVEVISHREMDLHPNLAAVYERVLPATDCVGKKFPAAVRNLSTNGAFIAGQVIPLLSRVSLTFPLPGHGQVEVLGWTLWRRKEDCEVPREGHREPVKLPAGFGLLFESIPWNARQHITSLVVDRNGT